MENPPAAKLLELVLALGMGSPPSDAWRGEAVVELSPPLPPPPPITTLLPVVGVALPQTWH